MSIFWKDTSCCHENSSNCPDGYAHNKHDTTKEDIKIVLAETRAYILHKGEDLTQTEHTQGLRARME